MGNINIDAIKNEVVRYGDRSAFDLQPAILSSEILLNRYAKPLAKVKGNWSFPSVFLGSVVQAFSDKWTPFGEAQFRNKVLKNFHQKVNFPVNPYDIYGSWEEKLYEEDKKPADMPIAKYLTDMLAKRITAELANITITGVYDATNVGSTSPVASKSMNGLNKVVDLAVASTTDKVFYIPVDAALLNTLPARVDAFEKGLPQGANVPAIFMSLGEFQDYVMQRETPANEVIDYTKGYRVKSRFGRDIIGVPGLTPGRFLAWVDGNLFRLYDRKDNPAMIDDVQVQDYTMKVFIQWHLGYDFAVNQYLYVETHDADIERGLNDAAQNELYYPNEIGLEVPTR